MSFDAQPGTRVTVRHRVGGTGPSGGPALSDVVGRVLTVSDAVRLERRDGSQVVVSLTDVVAWRAVPDRPLRRRPAAQVTVDDLQRICSRGWPALDSEPLGDWELRAAAGFTGRANSVLVAGDPARALDEALATVTTFYRDRGLVPQAQVEVGSAWESDVTAAGWLRSAGDRPGAVVQVRDLGTDHALDPDPDTDTVVDAAPTPDWLARYGRLTDDQRDAALAVLTGPPTVGFVRIGSPAVAVGRVVVTGEWAGISAVETHPDHRRRGLGRRITTTALAWAAAHGADKAYLQTMPDNTAALALYADLGFTTHHAYRYLVAPD